MTTAVAGAANAALKHDGDMPRSSAMSWHLARENLTHSTGAGNFEDLKPKRSAASIRSGLRADLRRRHLSPSPAFLPRGTLVTLAAWLHMTRNTFDMAQNRRW